MEKAQETGPWTSATWPGENARPPLWQPFPCRLASCSPPSQRMTASARWTWWHGGQDPRQGETPSGEADGGGETSARVLFIEGVGVIIRKLVYFSFNFHILYFIVSLILSRHWACWLSGNNSLPWRWWCRGARARTTSFYGMMFLGNRDVVSINGLLGTSSCWPTRWRQHDTA